MTPKERLMSRIKGERVDRLPNLNIIMQFSAKYSNVLYGKYCADYRELVRCDIKCSEDFGLDILSVISDPFREASGFGENIIIHEDDVPTCEDKVIKDYGDLKKLSVIKSENNERMLDRIKGVELFKKEAGDHYPICGWVEGSVAEAADLRDMNDLLCDVILEPDFRTRFARDMFKTGDRIC